MAGTVNKVILLGRLGGDPDVRYTPDGSPIVNFTMATNEPVKTPDGNWEERAEWHKVVAFGKQAEICSNYLNKGKQVYIEGKLRTRQWEDNQGNKRYTTEVVVRDLVLLGGSGDRPAQASQGDTRPGSPPPYPSRSLHDELPPAPPSGSSDEDIPF